MIPEERLEAIIKDAQRITNELLKLSQKPTKTQIKNLPQVLSSLPSKGRVNLLHLQSYLRHQAGRGPRYEWARKLLSLLQPYFEKTYDEMEYLLGYLTWEFEYSVGREEG